MSIWRKIGLALALAAVVCLMVAAAEGEYPESAHPYENNTDQSWEYVHPEPADCLKVTFSDDTATETNFDFITIIDAAGGATSYSGTQLAGKAVYLPGSSFTIQLTSDGSLTAYGFCITEVAAISQAEYDEYLSQPHFSVINGALTDYTGPNGVVVPETVDGQTVTSVGAGAFAASNVVTVELPETVTSIGDRAFQNCASLMGVKIPSGVTYIGDDAFQSCTSLTDVSIPAGVTKIQWCVFDGCTSLKEVQLREGLTEIQYNAFRGCTSLTEVDLPAGLTAIGSCAFEDCQSLTSVSIPSSVTSIGTVAFRGCTSLAEVDLATGLTVIGSCAFENCQSLTSVKIPSGVEIIEDDAFHGCTSLTEVDFPEELTEIGNYAFEHCSSLTSVRIPSGVTTIGRFAFYGCTSLAEVDLPAGLTEIGNYAFEYCSSLTSVKIPSGVTTIGEDVFHGCTSLTEVDLPAGLTAIGSGMFKGCSLLTSVSIPSSVTSIGGQAFDGVTVLWVGDNACARQYAIDNGYQYISDAETVTWEGVDTVEGKIDWIISNYLTDGMSEYQRALRLYDWLCLHVDYDYPYLETNVPTGEHGVCGEAALLDGTAVCQGYAEAYEWLLEEAGIEAILVSGVARYSGGGHAWDLAKIDGEWYQFDATWDESGDGSDHDYFGLTDAAMETDHQRNTSLGVRCVSWAANYKYRNGAYDESLAQLRTAVEEKLAEGAYTATVRCDKWWRLADGQMLADILASESWSVPGRVELIPADSGYDFDMAFYPDEVPVTSIVLNGVDDQVNRYYMYPGYTARLDVVTEPEGVAVQFASLNEDVATVDESGLVTAVATGNAEVRVIAGNAVYRLMILVTPLENMSFWAYYDGNQTSTAYLDVGEIRQAVSRQWYKLLMDNTRVNWTSDDESVVTVDENGLVTAVGYGKTTIHAEWLGKTATLTAIVRSPVATVTLQHDFYETVADDVQLRLYASIDCADPAAYYENIRSLDWSSSDAEVLSHWGYTWSSWNPKGYYTLYGGVFDKQAPGVVTVEAVARDESGASDTCTVVVHSASQMVLPSDLDRIGAEAFSGSSAEEFVLPEGVTVIDSRAFAGCTGLKLVNLPSSVTEIADDAFAGCGALTLLCKSDSAGAAYAARLGIPYVCIP